MTKFPCLIVLFTAFFAGTHLHPILGQQAPNSETVSELLTRADIPGMGLAEIEGTQLKVSSFGDAAIGKTQVTDQTIFEAASLTKPVVGYLVMRLVEKKVLDLDDPLIELLPSLPLPKDDPRSKNVTVRMALAHMTGLDGPDNRTLTFAEEPGSTFRYYPAGYRLVQRVIENLTDTKLDSLARREVFEPLGMKSTSFVFKSEFASNVATRHNLLSEPLVRNRDPGTPANAAASLLTTAKDYGLFLREMLNPKVLSQKSIDTMLQVQIDVADTDGTVAWGIGWGLEPERGAFFHYGDDGSAKCFTIGSRSRGAAMAYFTNSFNGMSIADEMARRVIPSESPSVAWLNYKRWDSTFRLARRDILRAFIDDGPDAGMSLFRKYEKNHEDLDMKKIARWTAWLLDGRSLDAGRLKILQWQLDQGEESIELYQNLIRSLQVVNADRERQTKIAEKLIQITKTRTDIVTLNDVAWYFATHPTNDGFYLETSGVVELARKTCDLDPEEGNWKNTLGIALFRDGQWKQSIKVLKQSNEQGMDHPYNWLYISMSEQKLGNLDAAKSWFEKSMEWKKRNAKAMMADADLRKCFAEAEQELAPVMSRGPKG
ncbi:MAG: serine hydrolase domain-containing protein [Planctomycetota bacterium]